MSRETATEARIRTHLSPPSDLKPEATRDISAALGGLIADVFTLYLKTKNFHWHVSGPHFPDFHLLLDEHGDQIFRHHGRDRRARAQDRRHDRTLDRRD